MRKYPKSATASAPPRRRRSGNRPWPAPEALRPAATPNCTLLRSRLPVARAGGPTPGQSGSEGSVWRVQPRRIGRRAILWVLFCIGPGNPRYMRRTQVRDRAVVVRSSRGTTSDPCGSTWYIMTLGAESSSARSDGTSRRRSVEAQAVPTFPTRTWLTRRFGLDAGRRVFILVAGSG